MRKLLMVGVEVELLFQNTVGQSLEPYRFLEGRELGVSNSTDWHDWPEIDRAFWGSWPSYGSGEDTVVFDKESRLLYAVYIRLPDTVLVVNYDFSTPDCVQGLGQLAYPQGIGFYLERVDTAAYNPETDTYFCYLVAAEGEQDFAYNCALEVFPDLFILFYQQHYVGWKLQQASIHLATSELRPLVLPRTTPHLRAYLATYLTYFTDSMVEKMDDQDVEVKRQLLALQAELAQYQDSLLNPITEGVTNLLRVYFGICAENLGSAYPGAAGRT